MSLPTLDAAEEQALARRARDGDAVARDALITSGLRSVVLRARMLGLRGEELRDAVQSGAEGLIRAVDRFDPDRGVRLATYAWHWIGAGMSSQRVQEVPLGDVEPRCLDQASDAVDLLVGLPDVEADVLRHRYGLDPDRPFPLSRQAVAELLGLSVSQVRTLEGKAMRHLRKGLAKVYDRAPVHPGADPP